MYIAVPNLQSVVFRFSPILWGMLDIPRHRYFFSQKSLKIILEDLGFTVVKTYSKPIYPNTIKTNKKFLKIYLILKAYLSWIKSREISDAFTIVVRKC